MDEWRRALSPEGMERVLSGLAETVGPAGRVRLLFHSIAFGNLKPIAPVAPDARPQAAIDRLAATLGVEPERLTEAVSRLLEEGHAPLNTLLSPEHSDLLIADDDMARTIYSMGSSLLTWVQALYGRGLFAADARVLGMTSEGNEVAWRGYAAVSAAKVVLEAVARAVALEFAPHGIRANIIQAGVTDTPALRLIPGSSQMKAVAALRNPFRRLTRPEDVAGFICLMCTDEAAWVNGALLRVDGGEHIASM